MRPVLRISISNSYLCTARLLLHGGESRTNTYFRYPTISLQRHKRLSLCNNLIKMPEIETWVKWAWRSSWRTDLMTHPQPSAREFGDLSLLITHRISIGLIFDTAPVTSLMNVANRHSSSRTILRFLHWFLRLFALEWQWGISRLSQISINLEKVSEPCRQMSAMEQLKFWHEDVHLG